MRNLKNQITLALSLLLVIGILSTLAACSYFSMMVQADDLMDGISANTVNSKTVDEAFINSTADFSVNLFKKTITKDMNSLISPFSVMLALSMTANGADNETLAQMEKVLGGFSINELNEYLHTYVNGLPSDEKVKLNIANSIWFRNTMTVEKDFLQKNADFYNAAAYKSPFDNQTVQDINNWANKNTDGMIEEILKTIDSSAVMYLINAIVFDGQWEETYTKENVNSGEFNAFNGNKQNVDFMFSKEGSYIEGDNVTGFIKPYSGGKYSFVALLPNENVNINDYINSLTGESLMNLIKNANSTSVNAFLPKFKYEYDIEMKKALEELGMTDAFIDGSADFSKINSDDIFISSVLHKTFITVDENGTKAAAVTKVELNADAVEIIKEVKLDRPFVYAIIDNATNLPIFIGTVMSV